MSSHLHRRTFLAAGAALALGATRIARADVPRELAWPDLIPPGWVPRNPFEELTVEQLEQLADDSAEAERLMIELAEARRSAPLVEALDGQSVRLAGYVVPLDFEGTQLSEFLLVPYFGACIHVPPPPANQIVYVTTEKPYPIEELFDAVHVTGVLRAQPFLNEVGDAGYRIAATRVEPYAP